LAPNSATDYIAPYAIEEFDGQQVAFIGIDIADKTKGSSQPDPDTQFLDEVETTQFYVDQLASMGIHNVVVVTHYGYQNDLALAAQVTGIDAIVGGDSHNLLGNFQQYGLPSVGAYPTVTQNADGDLVCVVQAWQYSWVVGELGLTLQEGKAASCDGTPHLLLGDVFTRSVPNPPPATGSTTVAITGAERDQILDIIAATPELSVVTPDPDAAAVLQVFTDQLAELRDTVIGESQDLLCTRRVPNVPQGSGPCAAPNFTAPSGAQLAVNGGFIQQIVSDAFLSRSFLADLALQNGGGVRVTQEAGDVTIGDVYTILPFNNTLVNLTLSGAEVKQSVEDALNRYAANPGANTGAFPYGSGVRWDIDMTAGTDNRVSNLQVRDRATGQWGPIDLGATYVVVTNSFLAGGGDGAATFKAAADDGRIVDTFINYAQGLFDYIEQDLGGGPVVVPPPLEFSTQSFIPLPPPPTP
jgi:5'-nucleotidase